MTENSISGLGNVGNVAGDNNIITYYVGQGVPAKTMIAIVKWTTAKGVRRCSRKAIENIRREVAREMGKQFNLTYADAEEMTHDLVQPAE